MDTFDTTHSLFGVKRAIIGVVRLQALAGTPASKFDLARIKSMAVDEAVIYKDAGFHGINEAVDKSDQFIGFVKIDFLLKPLHDDPRFQTLLKRIGFPE